MSRKTDEKSKTVFILPALTAGGAERVLITLMNGLDRDRFKPALITINNKGSLGGLIQADIPFYSLQSRVALCLPKLYVRLKTLRPALVVSTMAHMNFALLLLQPLFPKTRFIVREAVTPSFILKSHPFLAPFIRMAYRYLYPRADVIISPAQAIINELRALSGLEKLNHVLLHNPVHTDLIFAPTKLNDPERENTVYFIAAGRLHHQKGFDRLIESLAQLQHPYNWKLTILGEGAERLRLEALIEEKGLTGKVSLPGLVENPWPQYAAADCFLMPSRWEGLPNAVLEALACGTPVIATAEAGGIEEIAALAPAGAVTVASDMTMFIRAIEKVKPNPVSGRRVSLLPHEFHYRKIMAEFSKILEKLNS